MTTYTTTFNLAQAQTGVSGHYPVLVRNSTYTPDNTIYAKSGDTVKFIVSEPAPDGASVSYNNTNVADTDPDPDEFTAGTTNQNSPSSWEYTLGSSAEDAEFYWFYFGTTVHSSGSGKKYSQRVRVNRVSGSPLMNGATSAITVTQGGTITFSVSGLSGLLPSNGTSNCLYFAIFNAASGGSLINPTSSGGGWDSSNNQLGKVKTTDTSTVLSIGSTMPTGTYYVYLTHFNAADTPGGNDFYGSEQRLSTTALQFTVQASAASGPSAFDSGLGNDPSGPVNLNTQITSDAATIAGISGGTGSLTVTASSSDGGGNPKVSVNSGTYATTGTVSNGDTVRLQFNAPSSAGTRTGSLTINGVVGSITVTSQDLSGGGGGSSGTSGTVNYGIEVLGPPDNNGNQEVIFGPNFRSSHHIASGSWSVNAGTSTGSGITPATSQTYTVEGMTSSNRDTVGVIIMPDQSPFVGFVFNVNYLSGGFSITNSSLIALSGKYIALRY